MRAQRQPNRIQAEIGTAAFVGDRKAIAADSDFALAEDSKTDASGTDDHDSTVVSLMRTEAGNRRVIHVFHTVERMRARNQRLQNALASYACKSHDGIHSGQGVRRQLR